MSSPEADHDQMDRRERSDVYWRMRRRERARDCATLGVGAMAVLIILALSGGLGWIEALTGCLVVGAGTLAYYVGSTPQSSGPPEHLLPARKPGQPAADAQIGAVIDALPLPAFSVGASGRLLAVNDQARRVFRMRDGAGALASSAIRSPDLLDAIEQVGSTGEGLALEFVISGAADEVWLAHLARRTSPDGGVLAVLEERTGMRRAEKARADFLANASHELRTPLTSLAGFIETMRGPAKDDKESWDRFLDIMFEQTERMRRLITDLLSLSRIELSEHQAPDRVIDLASIATRQVEALRPLAEERGVSVVCDASEGELPVLALRDEMSQVVQNFLSNALKYTPAGGQVALSCGQAASMEAAQIRAGRAWEGAARMTLLTAAPGEGPGVWLRVEDDGPGIDRQHLPRLGERFYRVDESRSGSAGGIGLGLAIVKHIMTRHRGGFVVESRPGAGSAFGVWLPLSSSAIPRDEQGAG